MLILSITDISSLAPETTILETVVSGEVETPVHIATTPVKSASLLTANKTYLSIGLTGELGHSLN
jgi:hypothetical protein